MERNVNGGPKEPTRHEKTEAVVKAILDDDPAATEMLLKLSDEVAGEAMESIKSQLETIK